MIAEGILLADLALTALARDIGPVSGRAPDDRSLATTVSQEHRYRLSAAIRPLLFWVGAKNVGGARIVWREGEEGRRGYELLLGSDPKRAPRRINRWGFVREDAGPFGATMFGVMNRSEDASLGEATSRMAREFREGRFLFKLIQARVQGREAEAESTTVLAPQDFNFRQVEDLRQYVESKKPPPRLRTGRLPEGTRPGLLFGVADLIGAGVEAARSPGNSGPQMRRVPYTFNAALYELVLKRWERVEASRSSGRARQRLVRLEFESRNLEKGSVERFTLVCGTEGALSGVPITVQYQPKWWFKIEGALDEDETL